MSTMRDLLSGIGFTESEAGVLLQSIENGPSTVAELATKSKLSRQATYLACEKLQAEGLISEVKRGAKRLVVAEKPSRILVYARKKLADFQNRIDTIESRIPELELKARSGKPVVTLYEGKTALAELFGKLQEKGAIHELYELTDVEAMHNVVDRKALLAARGDLAKQIKKKKGIYLVSAENAAQMDMESGNLPLPKEYGAFNANITVADDFVLLATFEGKIFSTIIESEPVAKAMRILFKLALEGIEKAPPAP